MIKFPLSVICISLLATIATLTGCNAVVAGAGYVAADRYINAEGANLAAQNYAVADYLLQQARTYVKRDSLIMAEPLTDLQTPEVSTTIARLIPEQIGIRLSQLGYRIDLGAVTTGPDTNYLRPSLKSGESPDFIITGTYLRAQSGRFFGGDILDVKARIIDVKNDRIVASFDYPIEADADLRKLSEPKPKIMRVSESGP